MKKKISMQQFAQLDRTTLRDIHGGGSKLAQAACNAGKQCSVWEPSCGDAPISCYCDYKFGVIGVCKGL